MIEKRKEEIAELAALIDNVVDNNSEWTESEGIVSIDLGGAAEELIKNGLCITKVLLDKVKSIVSEYADRIENDIVVADIICDIDDLMEV